MSFVGPIPEGDRLDADARAAAGSRARATAPRDARVIAGSRPVVAAESQHAVVARRAEGRAALMELCGPLFEAGLLPATNPEMEPEYLAASVTGTPGIVVAYVARRPVGFLAYVRYAALFPVGAGPISLRVLPHRVLKIVGYRGSVPDAEPVLARMIDELLRGPRWHIVTAWELRHEDPLAQHLANLLMERSGSIRGSDVIEDSYQVGVNGTFEEYLAERFTAKTRYNLRREVRQFEAATVGRQRVRIFSGRDEVDAFLADAELIARRTYQWRERLPTVRASQDRDNLMLLARDKRFRGYILYVDDVPRAFCSAFVRDDELVYKVVGYDPESAALNPGKVLLYRILEDLFATKLARRLDFGMGGPFDYKRRFSTEQRLVHTVRFFRRGVWADVLRQSERVSRASWLRIGPAVRRLARWYRG